MDSEVDNRSKRYENTMTEAWREDMELYCWKFLRPRKRP